MPAPKPQLSALPERKRPHGSPTLIPRAARLLRWFGVPARADDPRLIPLRAATLRSDDLADALVRWMDAAPARVGQRMFEQALEQGIETVRDAPAELVALFAQIDATPPWLDRTLAKQGADAMVRQGPEGLCALSAVSLMAGYLSSAATKPLARTGALVNMASKRLANTMEFVHAVATSDGMGRHSAGFKTTVRVRLMHAAVRKSLRASPDWRAELWGIPINQRDMVATHLSFTLLFIAGVTTLGRIVTAREREGIMHLWRYVSFLLGTDDALVPKTFREAVEIGALYNISEPGPDEDGRALAQALMAAWRNAAPRGGGRRAGQLFAAFMTGLSRHALGRKAAERLGIPNTPWKLLPPLLFTFRFANELLDLALPERRERALATGRRIMDRNVSVPQRPSATPAHAL